MSTSTLVTEGSVEYVVLPLTFGLRFAVSVTLVVAALVTATALAGA